MKKRTGMKLTAMVVFALMAAAPSMALVLDDFEDGDSAGWSQEGAWEYRAGYSVDIAAPGCGSRWALRVTTKVKEGWCGVGAPLPRGPLAPTAIVLDARGMDACPEINVDVFQSDGSRWWHIAPVPKDGTWTHIEARPADFFPVENPHNAKAPDFSKISGLWISLRPTDAPPAWAEIDNVTLEGVPEWKTAESALAGLRLEGPIDKSVMLLNLGASSYGDWAAVEAALRKGGAAVIYGAQASKYWRDGPGAKLTQGTFLGLHWTEQIGQWKVTQAGKRVWPALPNEMPAGKAWVLTTNDSIYRENNWPWVEVVPLVTTGYAGRNWIAEQRQFTGSLATMLRFHAGPYAGARVIIISGAALMGPTPAANDYILSQAARALAAPIKVDAAEAKLPKPGTPVTRANFFNHPEGVVGALDFGVREWSDPEIVYATRRLGFNILVAGVPWMDKPAADGSVIDWAVTDRLVADAEKGGWAVVFDPYCFGYGRFPWASEAGGKQAGPACIYNPVFAQKYGGAMAALARRYAKRPSVVAIYATPDTGAPCFYVDDSQVGKEAWAAYAAAHGLGPDLPRPPKAGEWDRSPARAAYIDFWADASMSFLRGVIKGIRAETPDMPILLRGGWLDVTVGYRIGAEFQGVAPHCECVETSIEVESTLRGFALRYGTPVSGENGWPKARGSAMRMTAATILLGGYNDLQFSFGGPIWGRPALHEIEQLEKVWPAMRGAKYPTAKAGVLIPDARIWAGEPPNFFSAGGAHIEDFMERCGVPFMTVSAEWPKLDGLTVLADDGRNEVLPARARAAIVEWVKAGGTLIAYPKTGSLDAAGGAQTLAEELGVTFDTGEKKVDAGRVVVLADPPTDDKHPQAAAMIAALAKAGATPAVSVTPAINQAVFVKGRQTFLVLYDKQVSLVGAFFSEDRLPATESALPTVKVIATAPVGTTSARELLTGERLAITGGKVTLAIPGTNWRVIEFTR